MKNNTFSRKLFIATILAIVVVLSALVTYTYARTERIVDEQQESSEGNGNPAPGYITLDDLKSRYDIFCCDHGTPLPGQPSTVFSDGGQSGEFGYLTQNDLGKQIFTTDWTTSSSNPYSGGTNRTYGYYTVSEHHVCTPKEAYILAEMAETNVGYVSDGQNAWWSTIFGGEGGGPDKITDLQLEAEAYEEYVKKVAVSIDTSTYVDTSYSYEKGGKTYSGTVKAPVIKYEPKWNEDANQDGVVDSHDNVTVSWNDDIQRYVVGPFSIDYVEAISQIGARPEVMFAGITNAKVYTDKGEVEQGQWDFEWLDTSRKASDYPHPNEVFYIDFDFQPEALYFENIHFDFIYMNAGGYADKLKGTFFECTWTPKSTSKQVQTGTDSDDNPTYTTYYKYWDQLTSMENRKSQTLAYGVKAGRWNNPAVLDWDGGPVPEFEQGTVILRKVVVDNGGNSIASNGDKFTFRVKINGETHTIKLKANETRTFKQTWKKGETPPTFSVEEIVIPDGYKLKDIENPSGSFAEGAIINVKAVNEIDEHFGDLKIKKQVSEPAVEDEVYKFTVYINETAYQTVTLTVPAGATTAETTLKDIKWAGDTAPSYRVEEVEIPSFVRGVTYEGQTGILQEGAECTVKAINDTRPSKGTLKIIKKVTELSQQDEVYKFKVHVDGFEDEVVTITVPAGKESSTWEKEYTWKGTDNKAYRVEEVEIPDFVKDVKYENQTGYLKDNSTFSVTAENKISRPLQSKIKILKTVSDPATQDEVYKFKVHVDGFEDEVVEILVPTGATTGSGVTNQTYTWRSDEEAPHYKVTEIEIPAGYKVTMTGDQGQLVSDKVSETTVSAYNALQIDQEGHLIIKKQVNGTNPNPDAEFTFKITITSANGTSETITQTMKANGSIRIDRAWKHTEAAPTYKVEEVNVPVGFKFKSIDKAEGSFANGETVNVLAENNGIEKGTLAIKKVVEGRLNPEDTFTFVVTVKKADGTETTYKQALKAGQEWKINETWVYGEAAPTYKVEEVNIPEGYKLKEITNKEGSFAENNTVSVTATNYGREQGRLRITKQIENATDADTIFHFKVVIGENTYMVNLRAGYSWESELITWNVGEEAPSYTVEEVNIPDGYKLKNISNASGKLSKDSTVVAVATNEADEEHEGRLALTKRVIIDDKAKEDAVDGKFDFKITISGTFEMDGQKFENSSKTIEKSLSADETYTTPTIKWKGKESPVYSITEVNLPEGWKFDSMTCPSGVLEEDTTTQVTCVNRFDSYLEYELTMNMAGLVWHDVPLNPDDKNTENSVENGLFDDGEEGIDKAEVTIYRYLCNEDGSNPRLTGEATAYDESGAQISWPVYTKEDGTWDVPKVEITALKDGESGVVKYGVEFGYDGQTYTPTDFLVTGNGNASEYKNASRAERNKFFRDSMAIEDEEARKDYNSKFYKITGDTPIGSNGETDGYSTDAAGNKMVDLHYVSSDSMSTTGATRKVSTLVTRNDDNYVLQEFIMKASTTLADLVYPFDNHLHLLNINKTLVTTGDKIGVHKKYTYSATYPYLQNINLGLKSRKPAELAATKDVYSSTVVIDQKMLRYRYNEAVDFENVKYQDYLNMQVEIANANIEYTLDLYKTDYYYRAAIYGDTSNPDTVGHQLMNFYKSLGYSDLAKEMDLDVYVTYKLSVYNDSPTYYASINELADYFDNDYELVSSDVTRYIQEANGVSVDRVVNIADKPTYARVGQEVDGNTVKWKESDTKNNTTWTEKSAVTGSDGKSYTRMTTNSLENEMLAPGERINLYVTFRVKNDATDVEGNGIEKCVRLGSKANIVEITNYSTFNSNTKSRDTIEGKVDKDSAPNNINIPSYNDKTWYEDDTDSAPPIVLQLYTTTRQVNGIAWEDKEETELLYGQHIGDGIRDDNEAVISGLTTELWEKVRVKNVDDSGNIELDNGKPVYTDYDFLWPEDYIVGNGKTLKELTSFDSTIVTSGEGKYEFTGVPTGNYVVRFRYGDSVSDSTIANPNGVNVNPANYDGDSIPAVYNGQDFKSSTYQSGFEAINDTDSDEYVDNEWHDLENHDLAEARVSDARDKEARRLEITSKSRVLTNYNTTVLNSANFLDDEHKDLRQELYEDYYMEADTAKINLNIENMPSLKLQKVTITNPETGAQEEIEAGKVYDIGGLTVNYVQGKVKVGNGGNLTDSLDFTYIVPNIDFGLEERASTEITLDKQIQSIQLTNNTGTVILNADYNIEYTPTYDVATGKTTISSKVTLNRETSIGTDNLQALNKDDEHGLQNFRYINYDTTMAQSLTMKVTYKFAIFNLGEVDRIGYLSNERFDNPEEIVQDAMKVAEQRYTYDGQNFTKTANADGNVYGEKCGYYLGKIYYKGDKLSDASLVQDNIVETRIDQLIDYVDNNGVFEQANNMAVNSSWRPATIEELDQATSPIIDKNIITTYEDGSKNIEDPHGQLYQTKERDNIILSLDENSDPTTDTLNNRDFTVRTVPYSATLSTDVANKIYTRELNMIMTRSIDAQINDDNAAFDNVAEIVKLDNTFGRRDITTIAGNINPKNGEYAESLLERDGSATELITFSPPAGMTERTIFTMQIVIGSLIGLVVLAGGIVVIKKKVLK